MDANDITFLILAQDSSSVLADCLGSCEGLGSCLVVDGGSRDTTIEIAEQRGARVMHRPYDYAAAQYNAGLELIETPWTFILDSDERVTPELGEELRRLKSPAEVAGFDVPRQNVFLGSVINHSGWWPDYNMRLIRTTDCRYDDRKVHARMEVKGQTSCLTQPILHHTYSSIEQYIDKLNSYTTYEVDARSGKQRALDRRSRLRYFWLKMPFKPLTRFMYMYVLRRGFLDGKPGLRLAAFSAFYEYVVGLKKHEQTKN